MATPDVSGPYGANLTLVCNVSYPTVQTATVSMAFFSWNTDFEGVDITDQNLTQIGEVIVSQLHLDSVNSSYCGQYSCSVTDRYTQLPTTGYATTLVDTGELFSHK